MRNRNLTDLRSGFSGPSGKTFSERIQRASLGSTIKRREQIAVEPLEKVVLKTADSKTEKPSPARPSKAFVQVRQLTQHQLKRAQNLPCLACHNA
jgi:lipopolysaccharide biosynthesis regulator YciM